MKDGVVRFRVTKEESEKIKAHANKLGLSVSAYVRLTALKGLVI